MNEINKTTGSDSAVSIYGTSKPLLEETMQMVLREITKIRNEMTEERKYSNMSTQTKEKSLLFSRDGVFCKIWRHTEFRTFFSCFYSFPEPRVTMGAERQGIYDSCHPRAAG